MILGGILMGIGILFGMHKQADAQYQFPQETDRHEGTWLVWQHSHTYGRKYAKEIEPIWLKMTKALAPGERVHIVAYDQSAKKKIQAKLADEGVYLDRVDFLLAKTNDVWSRDMGPMFVRDKNQQLKIVDFSFDGWGKKTPYRKDAALRKQIAQEKGFPLVKVPGMVLEGGSRAETRWHFTSD
ncbi:hypothetical protein FC52_GL000708 [Lactobacillus pasteurii DSM 23907 = CRBIP 24.76]|nr:hypothetical protein FC52_GL000708 [Lactobacillus pasteurii DSM 23907 = CRBIP 24.76]